VTRLSCAQIEKHAGFREMGFSCSASHRVCSPLRPLTGTLADRWPLPSKPCPAGSRVCRPTVIWLMAPRHACGQRLLQSCSGGSAGLSACAERRTQACGLGLLCGTLIGQDRTFP